MGAFTCAVCAMFYGKVFIIGQPCLHAGNWLWSGEKCGNYATCGGADGAQASLRLEFQVPCSKFQVGMIQLWIAN